MKRNTSRNHTFEEGHWPEDRQVAELEGYTEMGMVPQALEIAGKLLCSSPINEARFVCAMDAILIQANHLKRWRKRIEKAFASLGKSETEICRFKMLGFYVSIEDWENAEKYLPRRTSSSIGLLFSMWILLHLRRCDDARRIWRRCRKILPYCENEFDRSAILEALANYHAFKFELGAAENYWVKAGSLEPFGSNATTGLIQIEAVRGMLFVIAGQLELAEKRATYYDPVTERMLPGNDRKIFDEREHELEKYQRKLEKIVPPSEFWKFGLD